MMDVVMPDVDGIEATDAITKFDNDATVVMCTSVGQERRCGMQRRSVRKATSRSRSMKERD